MDKLAQVKIAPLVVNGQTIRFAQAEFVDAAALLAVILAAYAEFFGKLEPPSGAFAETESTIGAKLTSGGAIKAMVERPDRLCPL